MKIEKDRVAEIEYTLRIDGELVDKSDAGEPLVYLQGHGNIIPGLEKALEGKEAGDSLSVTVAPADAYGEYDEDNVGQIELDDFDDDVEVGATYFGETDEGEMVPFTVLGISDGKIDVDYNHMLAGETLEFDVKVLAVRAATEAELEHGHAHYDGLEEED